MKRRVVVTGLGLVTPIGIGREAFWTGLRGLRSGVRALTRFDASRSRSRFAGEVDDFDPADFMDARSVRRLDRYSHFAVAAARLALADAGLSATTTRHADMGVYVGSALGGIAFAEAQHARFQEIGAEGVSPMLALSVFGGAAACNVAMEFGLCGPSLANSNSCASGCVAVGEAYRLVRSGATSLMLAGGVETPLAPLTFESFGLIRALSTRNDDPATASRPFDAGRDGFVMAEAAAMLVLEERAHALARGATVYAELRGYGMTNDAYHMTAPRPDGLQAARSVRLALDDAAVKAEEVDYVNAHASSTRLGDTAEANALRQSLGRHAARVPTSGTKGYYGHPLGASGAIETALCALVLTNGWMPPSLNLHTVESELGLNLVGGGGCESRPRVALNTSFGFGGINAALVLSGADVC